MSGWQILVQQGPRAGQTFALSKPVITIGREVGNDIVLEDPQVSRHHARLAQQGAGLVIEDLGSTNGTTVNGQRLAGTLLIHAGDTLQLGDTVVLQVVDTSVSSETLVAGAPSQAAASYSPPPPPPSFSAPPPPPTYDAPSSPPGFGVAPPAPPQKKGSRLWLWGCGCLVVVCLIVSAIGLYLYFNPGPINALFKLLGIEMQFQ